MKDSVLEILQLQLHQWDTKNRLRFSHVRVAASLPDTLRVLIL